MFSAKKPPVDAKSSPAPAQASLEKPISIDFKKFIVKADDIKAGIKKNYINFDEKNMRSVPEPQNPLEKLINFSSRVRFNKANLTEDQIWQLLVLAMDPAIESKKQDHKVYQSIIGEQLDKQTGSPDSLVKLRWLMNYNDLKQHQFEATCNVARKLDEKDVALLFEMTKRKEPLVVPIITQAANEVQSVLKDIGDAADSFLKKFWS